MTSLWVFPSTGPSTLSEHEKGIPGMGSRRFGRKKETNCPIRLSAAAWWRSAPTKSRFALSDEPCVNVSRMANKPCPNSAHQAVQ